MFISKEKEGALVGAILGAIGGILISPTALFLISGSVVGAAIGVRVSSMEEPSTNKPRLLKILKSKLGKILNLIPDGINPKSKDTEFSLLLIMNSNKLQKYEGKPPFKEKKITLDETKALINQSRFFLITPTKATGYDDGSDLPEPDKETDFIIRITGQGKFDIAEHKTKMGLRDSITSPECTVVSMKKLISADMTEDFIRSI
jgi:hypothetical protein